MTATLDRKLAALRAHPSQLRHPEELEPRIRDWAKEEGEPLGVAAAEAFRVIVIEDDDEADEGPTHVTPAETEGGEAGEHSDRHLPRTGGVQAE